MIEFLRPTFGSFFILWGDHIYTTTKVEDFNLSASAGGLVHEVNFRYSLQVDLDNINREAHVHLASILQCFNVIVKQALREKKY
jgi:hypothetical protein